MTGRGRPFSSDPASNITSVRLTDSEHEMVKAAADLTGVKPAAYMRSNVVSAAKRDLGAAARKGAQSHTSEESAPPGRAKKRIGNPAQPKQNN